MVSKVRNNSSGESLVKNILAAEYKGGLNTLMPYREFEKRTEKTKIELLDFLKTAKIQDNIVA